VAPEELAEPARYVSKANVVREQAGQGIGTTLIEWTRHKAAEAGAKFVRIDVWSTNEQLQDFYRGIGFQHLRTQPDTHSGALFETPASLGHKVPVVEMFEDSEVSHLKIVIPLDIALLVASEALGTTYSIVLDSGYRGELLLPQLTVQDGATWPTSPTGFEAMRPEWIGSAGWGGLVHGNTVVELTALAFRFRLQPGALRIPLDEFEDTPIGGEGVDQVKIACGQWRQRFSRFGQLLLNQPLDLTHPAPAILSPPSNHTFVWAETGKTRSKVSNRPQPLVLSVIPDESPVGEYLADGSSISRIVSLTNDATAEVPTAVELLSNAILAIQRKLLRQAIIDLGGAAEASLTTLLGLASYNRPLGPLVGEAGSLVPPDTMTTLVRPRNHAVHRGVAPPHNQVIRSLEIVHDLVDKAFPDYSRRPSLRRTMRPQRSDLMFIV
jgi:hypothetical protein